MADRRHVGRTRGFRGRSHGPGRDLGAQFWGQASPGPSAWSAPRGGILFSEKRRSAARGSALLAKWLARSDRARRHEEILRLAKVVWRFDSRTRGAQTRLGHDVLRGVPSLSF